MKKKKKKYEKPAVVRKAVNTASNGACGRGVYRCGDLVKHD